MKAVSVRELKNNPSAALRAAREQPVMVLNRHEPEALLIHLRDDSVLSESGVRQAIATGLFRERSLSQGLAAKYAGLGVAEFIEHVSRLGIPVIAGTVEGVVTEFLLRRPHLALLIDVRNDAGETEQWTVEWGSLRRLQEAGYDGNAFQPGDRVVVTGQPAWTPGRKSVRMRSLSRPADGFTLSERQRR